MEEKMNRHKLFVILSFVLFLLSVNVMSVTAKAEKHYVVEAPVEEMILSFNECDSDIQNEEVALFGTISSADLKLSRSISYHYSGYPGDLSYVRITVTWEWLDYISNYNEDSLTISWDNTNVDWRFHSDTVVRKHYTMAITQSSWVLRSTDYSVRSADINGFIYDEDLIKGTYPTRNKGTITFQVFPYSQPESIGNFYLLVEYDHKIFSIGGGNGDSITFGGVEKSGMPILSYNASITYKYDSQSLALGSAYHNHIPY